MAFDLHDRVYDEISSRIKTLETGAPAAHSDGSAWSQEEVDQALTKCQNDLATLKEHWRITPGVAGLAGENHPATASCGNAQPCPHVLGLAVDNGVPV